LRPQNHGSVALICHAEAVQGLRIAPCFGLLAASTALVAAGCGSGGRLSHGDFVKRADAVCSAFQHSSQAIARPRTYKDIVAYVRKTRPLYEAARIKLTTLKPPAKDEPDFRTWLAADEQISLALGALGDAAIRHDFPGVTRAAGRVQSYGVTSRHAAEALGLQVCSQA